jgi:hypothetical protein
MQPHFFEFENDFAGDGIKCIPMVVRFKLDACGIKLKLSEWSKMSAKERQHLVTLAADSVGDLDHYRAYLRQVIYEKTGSEPTELTDQPTTSWAVTDHVPENVTKKIKQYDWSIPLDKWRALTDLQRFSLVKLSQSAHEHKNLPKAMKEFRLV